MKLLLIGSGLLLFFIGALNIWRRISSNRKFGHKIKLLRQYVYRGTTEGKLILAEVRKSLTDGTVKSKKSKLFANPGIDAVDANKLEPTCVYYFRRSSTGIVMVQVVQSAFADLAGVPCPVTEAYRSMASS